MQYNGILPLVNIDRVTLNSGVSSTKVELLLVLKSTEQQLISENVKIKILQCRQQNMFSFLTYSKEYVFYAAYPSAMPAGNIFNQTLARNKGIIGYNEGDAELERAFSRLYKKEIEISEDSALYWEKDGDMYRHYFSVVFDLEQDDIEHLSYFVFTDFDRDSTGTSEMNTVLPKIKVSCDCIISDRKVISQSYAFFLPDGELWLGQTGYNNTAKRWETAPSPIVPLQRRTFFNKKIQDFRTFKQIEASPMHRDILDGFQQLSRQNPFYEKFDKQSAIIYDSVVEQPAGTGFDLTYKYLRFKINLQKLLEDYSYFSSVYSSWTNLGTDWISVQVNRKRVSIAISKEPGSVNMLKREVVKWPGENIPVPLKTSVTKAAIPGQPHLLACEVPDNDLNSIDIGQYMYHVVVRFQDPYYTKLQADLNVLKAQKKNLETYYQLSTMPKHFNERINKFDPQFGESIINQRNIYIANPVDKYAQIFNQLNQNVIGDGKTKITQMISPETGSPSGIMRFIEMYERMIGYISRYLKSSSGTSIYIVEKEFNKIDQLIYKNPELPITNFDPNNPQNSNEKIMQERYGVTSTYPSLEAKDLFQDYTAVTVTNFRTEDVQPPPQPGGGFTTRGLDNPYLIARDEKSAKKYAEKQAQENPPSAQETWQQAAAAAANSGTTNTNAEKPLKRSSGSSSGNSGATATSVLEAQVASPQAEAMSNTVVSEETANQLQKKARNFSLGR